MTTTSLVALLRRILAPACALALPAVAASAAELGGEAVIVDGDTLEVAGRRVDLFGIDAPELEQTCAREGRAYPCGEVARAGLMDLVAGAEVVCRPVEGAGATALGVCTADGFSINRNMLHTGWALATPDAPAAYRATERDAKAAGRGLWQGAFTVPWRWREQQAAP